MNPRGCLLVVLGSLALTAGCEPAPDLASDDRPAVRVVRQSYYPRLSSEQYWETIRRDSVGQEFVLLVAPRVKTPAEGPWIARFRGADGLVVSVLRDLRVDVATGVITFVCAAEKFPPGDWWIDLDVQPGGMATGPSHREYRFRME